MEKDIQQLVVETAIEKIKHLSEEDVLKVLLFINEISEMNVNLHEKTISKLESVV